MNFELNTEERNAVVGAIRFRLKKISCLSEFQHVAEVDILLEATRKLGLELIKDSESGEITVKVI